MYYLEEIITNWYYVDMSILPNISDKVDVKRQPINKSINQSINQSIKYKKSVVVMAFMWIRLLEIITMFCLLVSIHWETNVNFSRCTWSGWMTTSRTKSITDKFLIKTVFAIAVINTVRLFFVRFLKIAKNKYSTYMYVFN